MGKKQHWHFLEEFCQPAAQTLTGTWRTQELQNTSKGNQSQLLSDDGVDHWATAAPCNSKSERYRELATEHRHASSKLDPLERKPGRKGIWNYGDSFACLNRLNFEDIVAGLAVHDVPAQNITDQILSYLIL